MAPVLIRFTFYDWLLRRNFIVHEGKAESLTRSLEKFGLG